MKSVVNNACPTPKSIVKWGMSSISRGTIPTPLNTIHAEFSTRIHKIMRFFFLCWSRRQEVGGHAFLSDALLGQCQASPGK
jgi:hypothetical protein